MNNVLNFQKLATFADKWNLPVMAEVFPGGFQGGAEWKTIDKLSAAVRVAAENGADVIKTFFIEEKAHPKGYRAVIENAQVPIVVLGGEKSPDPKLLLEKISKCMDSGASGVVIGRNIWGNSRPDAITAAVKEIIHDGSSVEKALKHLS